MAALQPLHPPAAPGRFGVVWVLGTLGGLLLLNLGCARTVGASRGAGPKDGPLPAAYTRRVESPEGDLSLEVALRRFVPAAPARRASPTTEVWLAAVTHLGSSNYYARLQRFLEGQDIVLYEGIGAAQGGFQTSDPAGFALQPALAKALGLRFQLASLDYRRPGWVNSDLGMRDLERRLPVEGPAPSLDQILAVFAGEGAFGGIARMGIAVVGASPRLQALSRLMLIETLGGLDGELPQGSGWGVDTDALYRVLVVERNAVVVRDLRRALARRPRPARVAVLYGAGHMPDLERRLRQDLGLVPVEDRWLRAFGVRPRQAGLTALEVDWVRSSIREELGRR